MANLVEEFLANGGNIQQVSEGVRKFSPCAMNDMVRGEEPKRPMSELSTFGQLDRQFGGSLTDHQLLVMAEVHGCE